MEPVVGHTPNYTMTRENGASWDSTNGGPVASKFHPQEVTDASVTCYPAFSPRGPYDPPIAAL